MREKIADVGRRVKSVYSFRLDSKLVEDIRSQANLEHRTLTNYIETLFIQELNKVKYGKKGK